MKLLLCALAACLAVPAQAQLRVGVDVGQAEGDHSGWTGISGAATVSAQRGVLIARLNALEVVHESVFEMNADRTALVRVGSDTGLSSSLELGVAVPLYRGVGLGASVGGRLLYNDAEQRALLGDATTRGLLTTVEAFAPGPRDTRLHLRVEGLPFGRAEFDPTSRAGYLVRRVQVGVSVPLRF